VQNIHLGPSVRSINLIPPNPLNLYRALPVLMTSSTITLIPGTGSRTTKLLGVINKVQTCESELQKSYYVIAPS